MARYRPSPSSWRNWAQQTHRTRRQLLRHETAIDRWIDILSAAAHIPRVALIRQIRTRAHLGRAIAALIVESCEQQAQRLYANGQRPPDGNDLDSRVTRAYWQRLDAARVAKEREEAEATDQLLRQWKAEQGSRS